MQAFVNLTLFALLLVISATAATSLSPTAITGNTAAAPVTTPAPAGGSNLTPAQAGTAAPGGRNSTAAPGGGNSTAAPGGGNSTAAPGGGNSTAAPGGGNSTAAPGGGNSTAAPGGGNSTAAPGGGNSTAAPGGGNSTAAPGGGNSTAAPGGGNSTAAPGGGNSTAAPGGGNSTAAPGGGNSTAAPGGGNSTAAPGGGNSTAAPGGGNSTAAPGGGNNTAAPGGGNSTAAPGGGNNTAAPGGGNSTAALTGTNNMMPAPATLTAPTTFIKDNSPGTVPSVTPSSVTSLKTSNPNPDTTNLCQVNSCTGGSYCVSLNNIYFCQCLHGYYYNYSRCEKGKVFPGIIQVKTPDTSDLENKKSINYEKLHKEVTKFFKDAFKSSDYGQTIIEQVSVSAPARSQMRADDKVVNVTVVNLFAEDTKENEMTILNTINSAISSNPSFANYTNQDRCEFYGCVKKDNCSNGFQCECQQEYERPNPYTATCLPLSRRCPYACNSKPNMQCLVNDKGSPECVCQAGYKMDDHEQCQACAFGYNGVNCEDNFELILTVLGTIAGILILGMVIALIFMRSKKTNDIEEQNLIENDFQNLKLQQTTGFSSPAEGSIFPKIRASFPRDSGMQNPYANPRGIPRPDY